MRINIGNTENPGQPKTVKKHNVWLYINLNNLYIWKKNEVEIENHTEGSG